MHFNKNGDTGKMVTGEKGEIFSFVDYVYTSIHIQYYGDILCASS